MSDQATMKEMRMQLALALRTMKALTENTVALKAAAAQTIAHLETIAAGCRGGACAGPAHD